MARLLVLQDLVLSPNYKTVFITFLHVLVLPLVLWSSLGLLVSLDYLKLEMYISNFLTKKTIRTQSRN